MKYVCPGGGEIVMSVETGELSFTPCEKCSTMIEPTEVVPRDWVSTCECLDLCGQGGSIEEAVASMKAVVEGYVWTYMGSQPGGRNSVCSMLEEHGWREAGKGAG